MTTKDIIDRLENDYRFECEGGPLKNCVEWINLKAWIAQAVNDAAYHKGEEDWHVCHECDGRGVHP